MPVCLPERQILNVDHARCVLFKYIDGQLLVLQIMGMVKPCAREFASALQCRELLVC